MKRIAEKVVLVAHICVTFVFALLTVLYVTNAIPQEDVSDNSIVLVLLLVLAVVYVGLCAYLLYVAFSEKVNVKRILLYYDSESETRAKSNVVNNIVNGCAKQVRELKVQKVKVRLDEKLGLIATIYVKASAENISESIGRLRKLLIDNFKTTLGLTFNAINFEISQLTKKFVPDEAKSKAQNEKVTKTETNAVADAEKKPAENKPVENKEVPAPEVEVVTIAEPAEQPKVAASNEPIEVEYEDVSEE